MDCHRDADTHIAENRIGLQSTQYVDGTTDYGTRLKFLNLFNCQPTKHVSFEHSQVTERRLEAEQTTVVP